MTVASECIVADELGLAYAAACLVDNLANGIAGTELKLEEWPPGRWSTGPGWSERSRTRSGALLRYPPGMALAVTDATLNGERVGVRCEDGVIAALGPGVEPAPGDDVLDGSGGALVPGLVNAHTHAGMTLFRGYADDLPLMEWLEQHIWPVEKRIDGRRRVLGHAPRMRWR